MANNIIINKIGLCKKALFLFVAFITAYLSACASEPLSPQEEYIRNSQLKQDCFKRGGTWNDEYKTCIGGDRPN